MKKYLFIIPFLLFAINVYAAPSNSMSISPSAVDGAVIEASDVNARHSEVSTKFNAHTHSDITQTASPLSLGDGTAGNKTIEINNADGTKPFFRFDDTNDRFVVSGDGTNIETIVTMTGATIGGYVLNQATSSDDLFVIRMFDDDGDTQIRVEASSDEDIIRMDTAGTERWNMTAAGERTMPTQPSFQVTNSVSQNNITADGNPQTIVFGTEVFDQNNDFASNTLTAPVSGRYQLSGNVSLTNIDSASTNTRIAITTSNRAYSTRLDPRQFAGDIAGKYSIFISVVADMDASDTATLDYVQDSGAGQTDIADATDARFSGFLAQ